MRNIRFLKVNANYVFSLLLKKNHKWKHSPYVIDTVIETKFVLSSCHNFIQSSVPK